jgi:hypothetical protein
MAEDDSKESAELRDLKNQVAMMTERQNLEKLAQNMSLELINSRIDLVKKIIPAATEKPLEGKTTMDASFTHVEEQVAYNAMGKAAGKIADAIEASAKAAGTKILVLEKGAFPTGEIPLVDVETQLNLYFSHLNGQKAANTSLAEKVPHREPPADRIPLAGILPLGIGAGTLAVAALNAAPSVAGIVSEVAGYLRSDYDVKGVHFDMSRESLVASVTGKLRTKQISMYNFDAGLIDIQCAGSGVMKKIASIMKSSEELRESEISLSGLIARTGKQPDEKGQKEWLEQAENAIKLTGQIQADTAAYLKSVSAGSEGKLSKLGQAILREKIRDLGISHLLSLGVVTGGGGSITRQERFWRSGRATFIGGSIVCYTLSKVDGEVVISDAVPWLCNLEYDLSGEPHTLRDIVLK